MSAFKKIQPNEITQNVFKAIGEGWMLITAQDGEGKVNTMTASWGGWGEIWGKRVAYIVIRPQRYTKEMVDNADTFSLSFLGGEYKDKLGYLGKVSGRDEDKIVKSGLTLENSGDTPYFAESELALICKKMYMQEMMPECFTVDGVDEQWYPNGDYHYLYIGEILEVLEK